MISVANRVDSDMPIYLSICTVWTTITYMVAAVQTKRLKSRSYLKKKTFLFDNVYIFTKFGIGYCPRQRYNL